MKTAYRGEEIPFGSPIFAALFALLMGVLLVWGMSEFMLKLDELASKPIVVCEGKK